jgi:hypothetical protein
MPRQSSPFPRVWKIAFLLACAIVPAGCLRHQPEPVEPVGPPPPPPLAIEPGSSVVIEFPADSLWHESGFLLRPGDLVRFEPLGEAAGLDRETVLVHIGRGITLSAFSKMPQTVSRRGLVAFRADLERLGPHGPEMIEIRIHNLAKE